MPHSYFLFDLFLLFFTVVQLFLSHIAFGIVSGAGATYYLYDSFLYSRYETLLYRLGFK